MKGGRETLKRRRIKTREREGMGGGGKKRKDQSGLLEEKIRDLAKRERARKNKELEQVEAASGGKRKERGGKKYGQEGTRIDENNEKGRQRRGIDANIEVENKRVDHRV